MLVTHNVSDAPSTRSPPEPVASPQDLNADEAQRRVLLQKARVDCRGGDDENPPPLQHSLERPRVVVGVAVRDDYPRDGLGGDSRSFERGAAPKKMI